MDESLKNKVAFITGAATGIGKETALLLAKHGAKIMIADINEVEGRATTKTINDSGGIAYFYKLDTSIKKDVAKVLDSIFKEHGSIELAVNNAGIGGLVGCLLYTSPSPRDRG